MIRKFNPMLFGMYCIEPSKRFAHRLLVTMISSVDVSTNFVFCLDFGRKEKKADEATEDPRDPKNAKLSCKSAKGVNASAVKQANYRRRQVLQGYIDQLRHASGKAFSESENSQALVTYFILCLDYENEHKSEPTVNEIVVQTARLLGRGERNLTDVVNHWHQHKTVLFHSNSNRGRGSAKWIYKPLGFSYSIIQWLKTRIARSLKHGHTVRIPWLKQELFHEFNLMCSRTVLSMVLRKLVGAKWGRCIVQKGANFDPASGAAKAKRTEFLNQYAAALKLQEEHKAVVAYFDETFLNTGHVSKHSWFKEGDVLKAGSKGRRLIVLHALTRAGWVRAKNDDGSYVKLTEAEGKDLQTDRLTAELIFEAKKADGDYHDSMDSETFIKWVKHRLLPTLRKLFPGKRYFFVLDNAKYHKARLMKDGKMCKSFKAMTKKELASLCVEWGIQSLTCVRRGVQHTFGASQFETRHPLGPSADELRKELESRRIEHPAYFMSALELLMQEESLKDSRDAPGGPNPKYHLAIFTPPYEGMEVQPTELAWAHGKNYVALSPEPHTKMTDLRSLLQEGFYGVRKVARWKEGDVLETRQIDHAGVDAKELIRHCHENANKWIVDDGVFDVKTMDELVAEAETDRLEREGGRRSFVVDFRSDTESEDDEEDIDLAEPADPEVAPAAVSARGVGSVGGSVGVSSSSGRVASVGGVSSSSGRRVSDGDDDSDLKDATLAWARCDIKTCNKWRMLLEPLAKKVKVFKCKDAKVEAGIASVICADECDNCLNTKCTCPL